MDTIICTAPGDIRLENTEEPRAAAGEALLRVHQVGICGTDLHAYNGTQPFFSYPRILGHELAAEILEVPEDAPFSPGDLVTVKPYFHCGECIACRHGRTNCCVHMQVYGVHTDGGMRSRIALPVGALICGRGLTADQLSLVEPLAIGAHGLRRAELRPNERVLIVGAGPIGMGTMLLALAEGAQVIIMDTNAARLAHCLRLAGNVWTVDGRNPDAFERVSTLTGGDMPTLVMDCTGNQHAINGAFRYMAHGGRYALIGLQPHDITFSHPEFHKREGTLMSSRNATDEDFDHVIALMRRGAIPADGFITHRIGHRELPAKFASLRQPERNVIKAVVTFDSET